MKLRVPLCISSQMQRDKNDMVGTISPTASLSPCHTLSLCRDATAYLYSSSICSTAFLSFLQLEVLKEAFLNLSQSIYVFTIYFSLTGIIAYQNPIIKNKCGVQRLYCWCIMQLFSTDGSNESLLTFSSSQ